MTTATSKRRSTGTHRPMARLTESDVAEARTHIQEAFAHAGLVSGAQYVCPACMKVHKQKATLSVRSIGTWKCFSSGDGGDAISLVQQSLGLSFPAAVNLLLGRPTGLSEVQPIPRELPPVADARPDSIVDPEVYGEIIQFAGQAGREAAAAYYSAWHISEEAVAASGAVRILDNRALEQHLVSKFGMDQLKACGLVVTTSKGKDYFLLNRDYPVIEPHITPKGAIVGMQFRPSEEQQQKIAAHRRYVDAAGDPSVPEAKYVPKFLSLSGVDPEQSLVGTGLPEIWRLPAGTPVWIVEGFKDQLAARTMGHFAYGMPGTGAILPERVINLLRPFKVLVAMDGDAAGAKAREEIVKLLTEHGLNAVEVPMPASMDATDVLVARYARAGHRCAACDSVRRAA